MKGFFASPNHLRIPVWCFTMGSSEEAKACKPEISSSPAPDQANVHVYPDWAAMQAYYGPRVAVPPYFNSAVASGHAPHPYMWGPPQHMMPPYGAAYAAIYPHGGVYAHPGVPLAATPLSNDSPAKSSGNSDRGLMKKLKGFDGLAMSIGNGSADSDDGGNTHSQSGETEGSSEGSDGNTKGGDQTCGKRSWDGSPNNAKARKVETQSSQVLSGEANGASKKVMGVTISTVGVSNKLSGAVLSASPTTELELRNSPTANVKTTPTTVQQSGHMIPSESLLQNERELKRERRKQSNRESARRSRLRKQAEAEELAIKVDSLAAENLTLKSEINRLTDNSEKLKHENAKLMEKLKNAQQEQIEDPRSDNKGLSLSTANLLSRVNNSSSSIVRNDGEGEIYENTSKSGAKLHQLLDSSPRTDAVAAG